MLSFVTELFDWFQKTTLFHSRERKLFSFSTCIFKFVETMLETCNIIRQQKQQLMESAVT